MINWDEQWALHAPDFREGMVHLEQGVRLKPGPGFGDFSHPTTRLVIALMTAHVEGKKVIDIGCGSGILALTAMKLGAASAIGFDIDEEAVAHARENAQLNNLPVSFYCSSEVDSFLDREEIALMNMIYTEQNLAWNSHAALKHVKCIISSGVLATQREEYLTLAAKWNWKLVREKEEEGWFGFEFSNASIL